MTATIALPQDCPLRKRMEQWEQSLYQLQPLSYCTSRQTLTHQTVQRLPPAKATSCIRTVRVMIPKSLMLIALRLHMLDLPSHSFPAFTPLEVLPVRTASMAAAEVIGRTTRAGIWKRNSFPTPILLLCHFPANRMTLCYLCLRNNLIIPDETRRQLRRVCHLQVHAIPKAKMDASCSRITYGMPAY